jgi:hypothetical protein
VIKFVINRQIIQKLKHYFLLEHKRDLIKNIQESSIQMFDFINILSCKSHSYKLPSSFNSRTTSLGYGKKSNFIRKNGVPGPNNYRIRGSIENDVRSNKGLIFGVSREVTVKYFQYKLQ